MKNNLTWLIGGEAGFGIQSAGHYFALACSRGGLFVFGNAEYPSLIRGGHNSNTIRVADFEVSVHKEKLNLILAMNEETLLMHGKELVPGGAVIYDAEAVKNFDFDHAGFPAEKEIFAVPLRKIAFEIGKGEITRNTVGVAASFAVLGYDLEIYLAILTESFGKKGGTVVENNLAAARAGYQYVLDNYATQVTNFGWKLEKVESAPRRMLITGNDATCLGALKAGVKFVAEYPMTPSSGILHFMSKQAKDFNIIVKHTEDELAAMNMVVGASWAGARAMTATSGGGFSLMVEAMGMAGMIETPAVIIEGQRGGPSTGLPTRTEQSDLQFVMHASQGEFPRAVLAAADMQDLFYLTFKAFNLAEKYQIPVVVLSDKHLAECIKNYPQFETSHLRVERGQLARTDAEVEQLLNEGYLTPDKGFYRYRFTADGISPRVIPGTKGGRHRASTDEHDETGDLTETEENRNQMMAKRMRKMETCLQDIPLPVVNGPAEDGSFTAGPAYPVEEADMLFITWGSPKDALLEVMQNLRSQGVKANLLVIRYFIPFHSAAIKEILTSHKLLIGVEMNYSGQMCNYLTEKTGVEISHRILKYSGRQFTADELLEKVQNLISKQ